MTTLSQQVVSVTGATTMWGRVRQQGQSQSLQLLLLSVLAAAQGDVLSTFAGHLSASSHAALLACRGPAPACYHNDIRVQQNGNRGRVQLLDGSTHRRDNC